MSQGITSRTRVSKRILATARHSERTLIAPRSEQTIELRRRIKGDLEAQMWDFFTVQGGQVAIYDANNGNLKSRQEVMENFASKGVHVIFLGPSLSFTSLQLSC